MDRNKKDLVIPKSLGNFVTEGGSGGGITPEEAAEIASAVTEAAIDEYNTELQVELEEIRDAISGNTDTLLDLAEIAAMSIADRVALFDEIFEKVSNGEKIYIKGLVQEETIRTAILPLVSYRPETNPVLHQGGNLYFAAKGDTDNVYFHIGFTSEGSIDPTSGNIIKRNIYNLPTASAEVKGGVRIGSGLTMTQDTLSVDTTGLVTDGDLAPYIVQQSANTQDIASLSAATEAISESLGNYATTAVTNELATAISGVSESLGNYATTATTDTLSAVTSALTENLEALSAVTSGLVSSQDIVYDYAEISRYTAAQKQALWNEIIGYRNTNKKVWIRHLITTEVRWYLCYKFDAPYIYFVANDNRKIYMLMFNQTGSFSNSEYVIQYQLSAGSGISISNNVASVKIGEGLAFSGDTLVVSGGSGEQNYVIADALSAVTNPVEGMMAYVPSYVKETNTYTKIYISDFEHFTENTEGRPENYLARIHWGDWDSSTMGVEDLLAAQVYQSGNELFWDWSNDGKYHTRDLERDGNYYKIEYRCYQGVAGDGSDAYFEFRAIDETPWGDYIVVLTQYVSTAATSYDVVEPAKTYTYNGEDWVRASDFVYDWRLVEPATSADTAELLSDIRKNLENGIYPSILREGSMLKFEGNESQWASFYVAGPGNSEHRLYLSDSVFDDNEFDSRGVRFDNASLVDASIQVFNWLEADYSTGHLSGDYSCVAYGSDSIWKVWFKRGNGDDTVVAPLKWRNHYTTEVEGEQKNVWVFGADIPFETASGIEVWSGVWSVLQDDWYEDNAHTLSWTKISGPLVDSNYPIYTPSE